MDHKRVAEQIVERVGGADNIAHAEHCMTRLRLNLNDRKKVNQKEVESIPGVLGVVDKGGQFQVVIGGEVPKVFQALDGVGTVTTKVATVPEKRGSLFSRFLDTLSGVFVPILPAIIGAGMLKGLLSTLSIAGWVDPASTTYVLLNAVGDAAFFFLPVLVAFSGAKKFGMNQYVASAIAMAVLYPTIAPLLTAAAKEGTAVTFFGLPVYPATYSSSVIAMFVTVWLASYVERFFNRVVHHSIRVIFSPMLTIFVMVTAFFVVIGPLGALAGTGLAEGITWLFENTGPLGGIALGAGWCLLVMCGMHYALVPVIITSIATQGYDYILVCGTLANMAQGAAAIAVFFKLRNKSMKPIALSAGITAFFGVTEPVIYGVNLRYKRPFIAGLIGGGVAGGVALAFQTKAYSYIKTGIQGLPMFIGPTFLWAIVSMVIAVAVAFTVAYLWGIKETDIVVAVESTGTTRPTGDVAEPTSSTEGTAQDVVAAPVAGVVVPLSEVPDRAFAAGIVGTGIAIKPANGHILSPVRGTVAAIFKTNHAVGLLTEDGAELLIHVGIDTVRLAGRHFTGLVKAGDQVEIGTPLIDVDLPAVESSGYETVTPIVVTNGAAFELRDVPVAGSSVTAGEPLFRTVARQTTPSL